MQLFHFVKVERRKLRLYPYLYLYLYLYSHWRPIFHLFCLLRHSLVSKVVFWQSRGFLFGRNNHERLPQKKVIIDMFESGTCRLLPKKTKKNKKTSKTHRSPKCHWSRSLCVQSCTRCRPSSAPRGRTRTSARSAPWRCTASSGPTSAAGGGGAAAAQS